MSRPAKRRTRTFPFGTASRVEVVTTDLDVYSFSQISINKSKETDPTADELMLPSSRTNGKATVKLERHGTNPTGISIKATQGTGTAYTGDDILPPSDFVDGVIQDKVFEVFAKERKSDKLSISASKPRFLPEEDQAIIDYFEAFKKKNKGKERGWKTAAARDYGVIESTVTRRWVKIQKKIKDGS